VHERRINETEIQKGKFDIRHNPSNSPSLQETRSRANLANQRSRSSFQDHVHWQSGAAKDALVTYKASSQFELHANGGMLGYSRYREGGDCPVRVWKPAAPDD
jgi:hypothetical protein